MNSLHYSSKQTCYSPRCPSSEPKQPTALFTRPFYACIFQRPCNLQGPPKRNKERKRKTERKKDPCCLSHLFPRGPRQDEGGEDGQGVLVRGRPALDGGPHGEAEEGHRLGQGERLVVLLGVSAEQPCTQTHIKPES